MTTYTQFCRRVLAPEQLSCLMRAEKDTSCKIYEKYDITLADSAHAVHANILIHIMPEYFQVVLVSAVVVSVSGYRYLCTC